MTIDRRDTINIPKWLFILIIPLILGGVGGIVTSSYTLGGKIKELEVVSNSVKDAQIEIQLLKINGIEDLRKTKADKEMINRIEGSLLRIETKLDNHINK